MGGEGVDKVKHLAPGSHGYHMILLTTQTLVVSVACELAQEPPPYVASPGASM